MKEAKAEPAFKRSRSILDQLEAMDPGDVRPPDLGLFPPTSETLPPLAVYRCLRDRFGPPNIPSREGAPWGWALKSPHGILAVHNIYGTVWLGPGKIVTDELKQQARELLAELGKLREVKGVAQQAAGGVFINTYRMYREMASALEGIAEEKLPQDPRGPKVSEASVSWPDHSPAAPAPEVRSYLDELKGTAPARRAALTGALLAHILSLEAFLNLIYHLFVKPEFADERMRRRLEREELDLKLRLIGTYCDCFEASPITTDDEEFKAFCYLVELRKNLAHAKLAPGMEKAIVVEEERFPFVVPIQAEQKKYGISGDATQLNVEMVRRAGIIVFAVTSKLMRAMRPTVRYPFATAGFQQHITYIREADGRVRIVLDEDEASAAAEQVDELLGITVDLQNFTKQESD